MFVYVSLLLCVLILFSIPIGTISLLEIGRTMTSSDRTWSQRRIFVVWMCIFVSIDASDETKKKIRVYDEKEEDEDEDRFDTINGAEV